MGLLKKSWGAVVLLSMGAILGLGALLEMGVNGAAAGRIYRDDISKALMQLSLAGVLVGFGNVLGGYYAKNRKFTAYVRWLKIATAVFCVIWSPYVASSLYYDVALRKYGSLFTMPFQIALDLLLPLALITGFVFVFDMAEEVAKSWEVK